MGSALRVGAPKRHTARRLSRPIGRSAQRLRPKGRSLFVGYRFVLRYPNKALAAYRPLGTAVAA